MFPKALFGAMTAGFAGVLLAGPPDYPPRQVAPASKAAGAIFEDYRAFALRQDPIEAGLEGEAAALSQLPRVDPQSDAARKHELERFMSRLDAAALTKLDHEDRVNVRFLRRIVGDSLQEIRFDSSRIVFNSETGPEDILATMMRAAALRTGSDVAAYLRRLSQAAGYIDAMTENARRGIRTGFTQPRLTTQNTLAQLKVEAALPAESDISYKPLLSLPSSVPASEQQRLRQLALATIDNEIRPAEQRFVAMLENEYLPKTRNSLGAGELPEGHAYYVYLAQHFTTTDLNPDQIHALGLEQVKITRAAMDEQMAAAGWRGDFAGFIKFLRTDPKFYANSREELYMRAATIAKEIDGVIPQFFATPPRLTYGVVEVPREIEEHYTTGRYDLGSPEAGLAGHFVINTSHLDQRQLYDLPDLAMHEAVPGHHLQIAIQQEIAAPWFRRHYQVDAFAEGWAHYAETLGVEMGIYRTPYEKFGMLSAQMWRACRLVADTGIHWKGWTLDQARRCFYENSALAPHNIETELQRYVAWPGQALAYKIGQLKILELRERAKAALGAKFNLKDFHAVVLENGAVPLTLLERVVNQWIDSQKG